MKRRCLTFLQSKLIHEVVKCIQIAYIIDNRFSTNYTTIIKIYTYQESTKEINKFKTFFKSMINVLFNYRGTRILSQNKG